MRQQIRDTPMVLDLNKFSKYLFSVYIKSLEVSNETHATPGQGLATDNLFLTLSYTVLNEIATFTAVDEDGRCSNNGI